MERECTETSDPDDAEDRMEPDYPGRIGPIEHDENDHNAEHLGQYYRHEETRYSVGVIMRTLTAVLYREEDMYVAECPEVGTVSQGRTVEEAVANLKEATESYLEEFPLEDGRRAIITTFEVAEGIRVPGLKVRPY
jgi:predicted RNase H-like HicB family nuclease